VYSKEKHVCSRIGDSIIDLAGLFDYGFLPKAPGTDLNIFKSDSLN